VCWRPGLLIAPSTSWNCSRNRPLATHARATPSLASGPSLEVRCPSGRCACRPRMHMQPLAPPSTPQQLRLPERQGRRPAWPTWQRMRWVPQRMRPRPSDRPPSIERPPSLTRSAGRPPVRRQLSEQSYRSCHHHRHRAACLAQRSANCSTSSQRTTATRRGTWPPGGRRRRDRRGRGWPMRRQPCWWLAVRGWHSSARTPPAAPWTRPRARASWGP